MRGKKRYVALGALSALAARHVVRKRVELKGPHDEWTRSNFHGREVSLSGGVITAATVTASAMATSLVSPQVGFAQAIAAGAGGALGYLDDCQIGPRASEAKGFHGHLGALARGEVTSGVMKIVGIGAGAAVASVALTKRRGNGSLIDFAIDTALIAGSANIVNLLDLRPGRALKVSTAAALAGTAAQAAPATVAGAVLAASLAEIRDDLDERHMLGDTGANALGAALGVMAASTLPRSARIGTVGALVGAMAASEKVSFSQVIESTPVLSTLANLGRRTDA